MDHANKIKFTRLMRLIQKGYFNKARIHCESYPNEASISCIVNGSDMLPIHFYFEQVTSSPYQNMKINCEDEETLLYCLIDAYPDGLKQVNSEGSLPLHLACKNGARFPLILKLVNEYSRGLNIMDDYKRMPLHWSCGRIINKSVVSLLLEECPEAASIRDTYGLTPMNLLRYFNAPAVVEDIIGMIPEQCSPPTLYSIQDEETLSTHPSTSCESLDSISVISSYNENEYAPEVKKSIAMKMRLKWSPMFSSSSRSSKGSPNSYCKSIESVNQNKIKLEVNGCHICGGPQKPKKNLSQGLVYIKKKHSICGHTYFDVSTCHDVFMDRAYEAGIVE